MEQITQKFHTARGSFSFRLASSLDLTTHWVKCTRIALQHATSLALKFDSNTIFSSGKHKSLTEMLKSKIVSVKNFYVSKVHKIMWNSK